MKLVEISEAKSATDFSAGKVLIAEYAANLGIDLCFQNFAEELESLTEMYIPPDGCLLIARIADELVGCVAVRQRDSSTCEMKRLYVQTKYRERGTGRQLAETATKCARRLGYTRMILDTLPSMTAAHVLYRSIGFKETSSYYPNPLSGVRYMVLELDEI